MSESNAEISVEIKDLNTGRSKFTKHDIDVKPGAAPMITKEVSQQVAMDVNGETVVITTQTKIFIQNLGKPYKLEKRPIPAEDSPECGA